MKDENCKKGAKLRKRRSSCPISFTLDILGDKWTLLVLRDVLFKDCLTYSEFLNAGEGVSTNILTSRLRDLTRGGLLSKKRSSTNHKVFEYVPTEKALDLIPMMLEMIDWGARYDPRTGAPREFLERLRRDRDGVIAEFRAKFEKLREPLKSGILIAGS